MSCCLRRDSDEEYESIRAVVGRGMPEIERKWFTIRILLALTSVVCCLLAPGIGMYKFPALWPHVIWASFFLAMLMFMVNMVIGVGIDRRVKRLVQQAYTERFALPESRSLLLPGSASTIGVGSSSSLPAPSYEDLYASGNPYADESCVRPEVKVEDADANGCHVNDLDYIPNGSLKTMDAITGGLRVALGSPRRNIQVVRTVDIKPISPSQRTSCGESRTYDEDNSYDPMRRSALASRSVADV